MIESVITELDLNLLNTGESTHFCSSSGNFSSVDLSLCDPCTSPHLLWLPLESLYDSNHFPILITDHNYPETEGFTKWRISNANWDLFRNEVDLQLEETSLSDDTDHAIHQLTSIITKSAENHIEKLTINPWWNETCNTAVKECKRALNRYRRTRDTVDFINFKKDKAFCRKVLKQS